MNSRPRIAPRGRSAPARALLAALLAAAALLLCATPALALRGHAFGKAFGSSGSGPGQLKEPRGVAVNEASNDVYVVDQANDRVEWFSSSGAFEGQFDGSGSFEVKGKVESGEAAPAGAFLKPDTIAVDNACVQQKLSESTKPKCKEFDPSNGDVYVQDSFEHKVIDKFSPTGEFIGQVLVPKEEGGSLLITGVAVDRAGQLWVAEEEKEPGFAKFSNAPKEAAPKEANAFIEVVHPTSGGFLPEPGLALDEAGDFYAGTVFSGLAHAISKFSAKGERLQRAVNEEAALAGEAATGVASEAVTDNVYIPTLASAEAGSQASVRRFDAKEPPGEVERFGQGHLSSSAGIAVNSATGQVYVADQSGDDIAEFPLEPPGPPTVEAESLAEVTAGSATLQAEVNPRGASTKYRFQYGRCASTAACPETPYEVTAPLPDGVLGADFEVHEVSIHPQDLAPASAYHFRVIAENGLEREGHGTEITGEEEVFSTQPEGVLGLLDNRGYEMVSPPQKHGTLIQAIFEATPIQAAAAGNAITYVADSPTEDEPQGYADAVQVLSSRGAGGWSSRDLTLAHEIAVGQAVGKGIEYRSSSEDLAEGIVQPFGPYDPTLIPGSAEAEPKQEQTAFLRTNYLNGDPNQACSEGCFTALATPLNVAEGVKFGEEGLCPGPNGHVICGPEFIGSSHDLKHVILHSNIGLSEVPGDKGGLYEWSEGRLSLISVLPSKAPTSAGDLGDKDAITRNAVSPDGERVVWSDGTHLYLRKVAEAETVELDEGLSGAAQYQSANAQTTRILFTDEGGGLYLYDTESNQRTTLVPAKSGIQGTIVGASEDGSYVYLVANAALGEGAVKGTCNGQTSNASNRCNLYELRESGGSWSTKLVAVLSGEDFPDFAGNLAHLTARVSPDGSHLAFMSRQPLSGYDNRDARSGRRDEEVYLFDAASGSLVCASCRATGARPEGVEYAKLKGGLVAGDRVWEASTWLAANVPGWTPYRLGTALYQSRYLSNSGRLFFNSSDALSPQDVNGTEDVYEYEPPGLGNCSTASPSYSPRSAGCVGLVSSGTSREESAFMDASETGGDVFFLTTSKLAPEDFDTALDIYDAHECTSSSPCIKGAGEPAPPCGSESSCKAPPTPQPEIFGAPASATFSGAGNIAPPPPAKAKAPSKAELLAKALKSCRAKHKGASKKAKRSRSACEAQARKKYGSKAPAKKRAKKKGKK